METPHRWILLIEDDEDDFILTRDMLAQIEGVSYTVEWVANLATAAAALRAHPFDAILVDYDLGLHTGLDFLAWAKAQGLSLPILLLTGRGSLALDLQAMSAGAVDYLSKGELTAPLLDRALRYAIEHSRQAAALRQAHAELEQRVRERTLELQNANDLLETVFASIHLQVAYLDCDLRFLRVNARYAARVGLTPAALIGRAHFDLFPNPENEAIFRRVLTTGEPYSAYAREFRYLDQPDLPTYWDWSVQPVYQDRRDPSASPTISGLILSLLEVTEQTRLTQREARQARRVQALADLSRQLAEVRLDDERIAAAVTTCLHDQFGAPCRLLLNADPAPDPDPTAWRLPLPVSTTAAWAGGGELLILARPEAAFAPAERLFVQEVAQRAALALSHARAYHAAQQELAERRRAEAALLASTALFENLFEAVPDAIVVIDHLGLMRRLNRHALTWFGYREGELLGRSLELLLPEASGWNLVDGGGTALPQAQVARAQDGRALPVEVTLSPLVWQGAPHRVCMLHDVSSRQRLEAELQEVQRRLMDATELERLHLAQELHDGPVQDLYGVIFQLRALEDEAAGLAPRLEAVGAALKEVLGVLRTITRGLRPPTLAPFGLQKTIASHAEIFQRENPELRVELDLQPDGQLLPERVRLTLFRIYQQALANVVRHAQANSVQVRFLWEPEEALLEVRDDGLGFQVPERWLDLVREGHLGLAGIAERVQAVDGRLQIRSAPGEGTQIRVHVPLRLLE